jgi:hypothetical protein
MLLCGAYFNGDSEMTHPTQDADNKKALEALNRAWVEAELVMKPEFESYYGTIRRALTTPAPQSEKMDGMALDLMRSIQFQRVYEAGYIGHWIVNEEGYAAFMRLLSILTKESPNNESPSHPLS